MKNEFYICFYFVEKANWGNFINRNYGIFFNNSIIKKQFVSIFLKRYDKILGLKFLSNINKIEYTLSKI
ncbi:hypothetical protein LEP1GSC024_1356 [Leptospira noguchii str. 2001034031]|uniref:Uncharacterized protein n=1 Tax=Leptospira noguchii str. 2001034031 TaxID=1193053 RepID=M6Y989_9LEPT|nr:hypothetical protein LEP1GSC024_1356 [Leptospira noguchii str. 2001034031]